MKYTKIIKLGARIISPEDVMMLSSFLEKQSAQLEGRCDYEVTFSDETTLNADQTELFYSSYFTRKDVEKITMSFHDLHFERKIHINLQNESFYPYEFNIIQVNSTDENWFNAACNSLTEIISGIKKRNPLLILTTPPWIAAPLLALPILSTLTIYGPLKYLWGGEAENCKAVIHPSHFFLICIIFLAFCLTFVAHMYPPIEFTYNAPRHRKRMQLRKICSWLFATLLIPIALSFFL